MFDSALAQPLTATLLGLSAVLALALVAVLLQHSRRLAALRLHHAQEVVRLETALALADSQCSQRLADQRTALQEGFAAREAQLQRSGEQLRQEFQRLAGAVLEERGQHLQQQHRTGLADLLQPFREQLAGFQQQVQNLHRHEARERAGLQAEVKALHQATSKVNAEAANLTRALKGDKRLQGVWGELVLEQVLEAAGLREGSDFSRQTGQRDQQGEAKRPDVVVHLPDNRDVVVDAKVSLVAWEQALASPDRETEAGHLAAHAQAVRQQMRRLAAQDYASLPGVRSLEAVLLFLPVDAAFHAALASDNRLLSDAFNRGVVLVTPSTLLLVLRIVQQLWRTAERDSNARDMAERAGALYDKLRGVLEDMERLGQQLQTAGRSWDSAMGRLARGKGNLVRQAEQFRALGARVKRPVAKAARLQAEAEEGSPPLAVVDLAERG